MLSSPIDDRRRISAPFTRRGGPGLGWAYLDARQARALALSLSTRSTVFELPLPLAPFPSRPRRRFGLGRLLKYLGLTLLTLQLCYMASTSLLIAAYRFVNPSATVLMAFRAWDYKWKTERPRPVPLRRVPFYVRSMLVAIEDDDFYRHGAIDLAAFKRAEEINARIGRPLYGGSTLAMQVARTLFLVPVKSYLRKYLEIVAAFELELFLPKNRILELYFGYAEWGRGIFGIEAASRHWYGAGIASVSREDAARLIALLSSPIRFRPSTLQHSGILSERYDYLDRHFVHRPEDVANGSAAPGASALAAASQPGQTSQGEGMPSASQPGVSSPSTPNGAAPVSTQAEAAGVGGGTASAGSSGAATATLEAGTAAGAPTGGDLPPPSLEPTLDPDQ
ncbi:MAG: biosynthetic peptidoglycan transglycosylase [Rectinemataceae bacterium]